MSGASKSSSAKQLCFAAFWLGFALSGFFDGILLHQVLQWHHLLSGLDIQGSPFAVVRFQVLADGYFHLLMYVIAALALWLLWRARSTFDHSGASKLLISWLLIGFGVWHFVDAVASHWVIQIHRIKMDAENPLLWDIGWLLAFGACPLGLGLAMRARAGHGVKVHSGTTAVAILAAITLGTGLWAAQRPPGQTFTTIVFAPWVSFDDGLRAAHAAGKGIFWFNGDGVFVVDGAAESISWDLYRSGAILVSGAGMPTGCFAWAKVQ
jgi:uncharacterized membrane protein